MAGEVTNLRLGDIQACLAKMEERLHILETEKVRNEALTTAVADLKVMMAEHMSSSISKSVSLERRFTELQLHMVNEINKLQKGLLIVGLGGAGLGAASVKILTAILGV